MKKRGGAFICFIPLFILNNLHYKEEIIVKSIKEITNLVVVKPSKTVAETTTDVTKSLVQRVKFAKFRHDAYKAGKDMVKNDVTNMGAPVVMREQFEKKAAKDAAKAAKDAEKAAKEAAKEAERNAKMDPSVAYTEGVNEFLDLDQALEALGVDIDTTVVVVTQEA